MNTYESKNNAKVVATIITIAAIVGIVILIEVVQHNAKTAPSTTATTTSTATPTTTTAPAASSSTYKDGTYTADASYYVPHGSEDIKVTLTVASGVVTNSSIVNSESDRDSQQYQEDFAAEYKTSVVGKNLADIKLSYVAGASDTTDGFNDAVAQIQTQAKA